MKKKSLNTPVVNPLNDVRGLILIYHSVLKDISFETIEKDLPDNFLRLDRKEVIIRPWGRLLDFSELEHLDWGMALRYQEDQFLKQIKPKLEDFPEYQVIYFGLAPIPLAVHLGYLIGNLRNVMIFQHNHKSHRWGWEQESSENALLPVKRLHEKIPASGDIVLRSYTSHSIDENETNSLIPNRIFSVDLALKNLSEDALLSEAAAISFADVFKNVLDNLDEQLPNSRSIHLFLSIPCGLALLLGQKISKTMHSAISLYQYVRQNPIKHLFALELNSGQSLPKLLNESEKQTALQAFQAWNDALKQKLQPFLESNSEVFITDFFPAAIRPHAAYSVWAKLPKIGSILTNCDLEYSTTTQEFRYDSSQRKWNISENLLYNLSTSTNSSSDLGSSAILFLLHEGLHLHQNLTAETAPRIGQFPKVVEEIDFIADVWAIILADRIQNSNVSDPSLENLITVLIKTLLGFDRDGLSARYFPLRRINRYLIWFWKLLELENLDDKSKGIEIIIQKPILELKGPMIRVNNQRIEMDLKQNDQDLELAFLNGVRIVRHGKSESTQIHDLVEGFRTQDFALIKRSLKSFYDKV